MQRVSYRSPGLGADARGQLVERIAQSRYIAKSVRLHDLLTYLCERVISDGAEEIHEQEVGHAVFGRPKNYDTALDNIVRVHASTLRKRLEQFFAEEGLDEPLVMELPKGNYAPLFHERVVLPEPISAMADTPVLAPPAPPVVVDNSKLWIAVGVAAVFAVSTAVLAWEIRTPVIQAQVRVSLAPAVRDFWAGVFVAGQKTDIVLDDAALALFQELDGRPIALSEYFDRSYLRRLAQKPDLSSIVLKRQASYSSVSLLWQLSHTASALGSDWAPHFARDYAFRELKSERAVLLGNSRSNPWIEPFESRVGIRWLYDEPSGIYYPSDTWAGQSESQRYRSGGEHPDGYVSFALLPNLGGTGNVMLLSGTGGAATSAASAFLVDGERMAQLRAKLGRSAGGQFPYFEALLRIPSRSRLAKDAELLICRPARK